MGSQVSDLPEGFVLDSGSEPSGLPAGFIADSTAAPVRGVFGDVPAEDYYGRGKRNIAGEIGRFFGTPGAAVRSLIQGRGYGAGARNPEGIPRFQDLALNAYYSKLPDFPGKVAAGNVVSAGGLAADVFSDPVALLAMLVGKAPAGGGMTLEEAVAGSRPGRFVTKYGNMPVQDLPPIKAAREGVSKAGQAIGRGVAEIGKVPDYLSKSTADYVTTKTAPRAYDWYQESVKNFTPQIQKFGRDELGIPESAINTVKQIGVDRANQIRASLGDSTDPITQRIAQGLSAKREAADAAYKAAMDPIPDSQLFPIPRTANAIKGIMKRFRFIDENGQLTARGEAAQGVHKQLISLYQDMLSHITGGAKASPTGEVFKPDFELYRDQLGQMYKEAPSDRLVSIVRNALYNDLENAGFNGLKAARALQKEAFDAEGKFLNSSGGLKALAGERSLDRFHNLPEEAIRNLKEIEQYIGVPFLKDLDALTAARALDKFNGIRPETVVTDMLQANNPAMTPVIYNKYKAILGESRAKALLQDVIAHRRGVKIKNAGLAAGGIATLGGGVETVRRQLFH